MKSVLIKAAGGSGKSTFIREVCLRLNPLEVFELWFRKNQMELIDVNSILNGTYILKLEDSNILVVAGSPTEQDVTLEEIISICQTRHLEYSFILIAMRYFEKKEGFDTYKVLHEISDVLEVVRDIFVYDETGSRDKFRQDPQWNEKVNGVSYPHKK